MAPTHNEVEKQLAYEKLDAQVKDIVKNSGHSELYGYDLLALPETETGKVVYERLLRKFLQANAYDVNGARVQLTKTLKWRKEFRPLNAAFREKHKDILNRLGVITVGPRSSGKDRVTTWNLYGAVANREELFGDLDAFLRWRVGLMEQGISLLDFSNEETSYVSQVHDYNNVSFLRMDKTTKTASSATIALFRDYYPEMLDVKYFVNVPTIMGWMFSFAKLIVPKETIAKFRVLTDGHDMAADIGTYVPKAYGGKATDLASIAVTDFKPRDEKLIGADSEKAAEPATTAAKTAEPATATTAAAEPVSTAEKTAEPTTTVATETAQPAQPAPTGAQPAATAEPTAATAAAEQAAEQAAESAPTAAPTETTVRAH